MTEYIVTYDGEMPVRVVARNREEAIDEYLTIAREGRPVNRELVEVELAP